MELFRRIEGVPPHDRVNCFSISLMIAAKILDKAPSGSFLKNLQLDRAVYQVHNGWSPEQYKIHLERKDYIEFDPDHFIRPLLSTNLVPDINVTLSPEDMMNSDIYDRAIKERNTLIKELSYSYYVSVELRSTVPAFDYIHRVGPLYDKLQEREIDPKKYFESLRPRGIVNRARPDFLCLDTNTYSSTIFYFNYRMDFLKRIEACLISSSNTCIHYDRDEMVFFNILNWELLRMCYWNFTHDTDKGMIFQLKEPYFRDHMIRIKDAALIGLQLQGIHLKTEPELGARSKSRNHMISMMHLKIWISFLCQVYVNLLVDVLFTQADDKGTLFDFAQRCIYLLDKEPRKKRQKINK